MPLVTTLPSSGCIVDRAHRFVEVSLLPSRGYKLTEEVNDEMRVGFVSEDALLDPFCCGWIAASSYTLRT